VDWEDMPRWVLIDKTMGLNMPQPPETYHTSAALYSDLDIPAEISGTLPTAERNRAGLAAEVEEDLGGGRRRGRDAGRPARTRGRRGGEAPAGEISGGGTADQPKRQRRRRRAGETVSEPSQSDGSSTPSEAGAPAVSDASSFDGGGEVPGGDERPRRQRRRGGRGNRGSGSRGATTDMNGGSEAGVGTTA
jgi:hypothetical protein